MPVIARGICAGLATNEPPLAINADVVLVAEMGNGDINQASVLLAFLGRLGLGILDRPARIGVLLRGAETNVASTI